MSGGLYGNWGNIESFPLADVITLLSNSGKSGILYINGKKVVKL